MFTPKYYNRRVLKNKEFLVMNHKSNGMSTYEGQTAHWLLTS